MFSHKPKEWGRRWKGASRSHQSRDESVFEKLSNLDDSSVDDGEQNKADGHEENDQDIQWLGPEQRGRGFWPLHATQTITALSITCLILLISVVVLWRAERPLTTNPLTSETRYHCGNSTSEARALDCEFDMLSYSWTPRACYDRSTAQEFRNWLYLDGRKFGPFPFFFDEAGTDHVSDELTLAESHGRTIYTTQEEHLGHCTFLMRRWHRLAKGSGGSNHFNSRFGKYVHTRHCTDRILNILSNQDVLHENSLNSRFGISFEKC